MISISLGLLYYLSSTFRNISIFTDLERRDALVMNNNTSHILNMSLEPQWYFSSPVLSDISIFAHLMQRNVVVVINHTKYMINMSPVVLCYLCSTCRHISILILREEKILLLSMIAHISGASMISLQYLQKYLQYPCVVQSTYFGIEPISQELADPKP